MILKKGKKSTKSEVLAAHKIIAPPSCLQYKIYTQKRENINKLNKCQMFFSIKKFNGG